MKHHYYIGILFFLLIFKNSSAQLIDVVTSLNLPIKMARSNDELFIVIQGSESVTKVDLTGTLPVPFGTNVIYGLDHPNGIAVSGSDLYIVETGSNKISKVDLSSSIPIITDFLTGLHTPIGLYLVGNDLYFSEVFEGKISKVDITQSTPSVVEVISGANTVIDSFVLIGNELYFSVNSTAGKISKIDIRDNSPDVVDVITGLDLPSGIEAVGNELYYSESGDFKISKINIADNNPISIEVLSTPGAPVGLLFIENELYIAIRSGFKVSKLPKSSLSFEEFNIEKKLKLFPNPSTYLINISGLTSEKNYTIYNIIGKQIISGTISVNDTINVKTFQNGVYFLRFEDGKILRFVKI